MTKSTSIYNLVDHECCNMVGGSCLGVDLFGKRFKEEGKCWIKEKEPCEFFSKCVLPIIPELTDEYIQVTNDTDVGEVNHCAECGEAIPLSKVKCKKCKRKTAKMAVKKKKVYNRTLIGKGKAKIKMLD